MQELRDDILIEKQSGFITENASKRIIDYIDNLYLEKEKEQIIDAYENGVGDENERNLSGKFTNAEYYYNKTYNK